MAHRTPPLPCSWVCLVRNHFPADPNVQWNATRLLLASMHIQYYTLNESEGGASSPPTTPPFPSAPQPRTMLRSLRVPYRILEC